MPARTTRQQARQRLIDSFMGSLDKVRLAGRGGAAAGPDVPGLGEAGGADEAVADPDAAGGAGGWPIGSGVTEAGVKQCNKRVKGSEQFWTEHGVETILALRASWISQDQRWERYWANRPAHVN
jgi:hypothetical protein